MAGGADIRVEMLGAREFIDRLKATPDQVKAAAWRTFSIKGQQAEQRMKMLAQRNFKWRSGALAGSLGFVVEDDGDGWPYLEIGAITEPPPYLAVQEFGGTISGRPWLTIPIEHPKNPMLTQSGGDESGGAAKALARDIKADPGQFGLRGTFVHEGIIFGVPASTKGGTGNRAPNPNRPKLDGPKVTSTPGQRRQERDRIRARAFDLARQRELIPIAVLKRSVTIPPRPFMGPVWEQMTREVPRELEAQVAAQIASELEAGGQ